MAMRHAANGFSIQLLEVDSQYSGVTFLNEQF